MLFVPVVSKSGKVLMPCHPARARELVRNGKAVRRFNKGMFYIKLTEREDGEPKPAEHAGGIAIGEAPGDRRHHGGGDHDRPLPAPEDAQVVDEAALLDGRIELGFGHACTTAIRQTSRPSPWPNRSPVTTRTGTFPAARGARGADIPWYQPYFRQLPSPGRVSMGGSEVLAATADGRQEAESAR